MCFPSVLQSQICNANVWLAACKQEYDVILSNLTVSLNLKLKTKK